MKKQIIHPLPLFTLGALLVAGCNSQTPSQNTSRNTDNTSKNIATLEISNPSDFARQQQNLFLPFSDLGITASQATHLVARSNGKLIPSQLIDHNGDGTPDSLLVQLNMAAAVKQQINISNDQTAFNSQNWPKLTQAEISIKNGGQWQDAKYIGGTFANVTEVTPPSQYTDHSEWIRYEGPGLESDKVGYRFYLDWRNGFDIFGNKTGKPVLHQVGLDGYKSYHQMADWGMDLLKVGKSLGAGAYGYWNGQQAELVSKVGQHTAKVIENGSLYSAIQIQYQDWQVASKTLNLTANLAMTAGSRLVHTRVKLSEPLDNLAIGLVKLPDTKLIQGNIDITGHAWTYVATWGNQSLAAKDDKLGMALLFKRGTRKQQTEDANSHVSVMSLAGTELEYYFLAAWPGEPEGIQNEQQFIAYLEQEAEKLTLTPRIRYQTELSQQLQHVPLTADVALNWSERLAESEMIRQTPYYAYGGWDYERKRRTNWEYTTGLLLQAYDDLLQVRPNPQWSQVISEVVDSFITEDGNIRTYDINKYNIDSINTGNILLREYLKTPQPNYRKALDLLRKQLADHPRTADGAFWHKKIYPHQLWLDGVYMGMPFLAFYSAEFENGKALDEVVKEFKLTYQLLRDPNTGLYFHAWDEAKKQHWASPQTGLASQFWGRGIGWLGMALVDVLDYIPAERTDLRQPLLDMITDLAATLQKYQDQQSGVWYQIVDKADTTANYLESSGSSMFVYFYAKALNKGYLPQDYRDTALKAYQGLINEFVLVHPDNTISLINTVQVAGLGFGRDGSYHYYMTEPVFRNDAKANGPFIMAGVQIAELLSKEK